MQELSQLQDRVPGFPSPLARSIVEKQLGATLEQSFASFNLKPLAAASLGQVLPRFLPCVHGMHLLGYTWSPCMPSLPLLLHHWRHTRQAGGCRLCSPPSRAWQVHKAQLKSGEHVAVKVRCCLLLTALQPHLSVLYDVMCPHLAGAEARAEAPV